MNIDNFNPVIVYAVCCIIFKHVHLYLYVIIAIDTNKYIR